MQLDNILAKYQLVPLRFAQAAVAASQTDVALFTVEVAGGAALTTIGYVMPWPGEILAISASLSAAATAGTLAVAPTIDGAPLAPAMRADVEVRRPALAITTATAASDTCWRGSNAFSKNALIGCKITTSGAWTAETMDLNVIVWVAVALGDIGNVF